MTYKYYISAPNQSIANFVARERKFKTTEWVYVPLEDTDLRYEKLAGVRVPLAYLIGPFSNEEKMRHSL